MSCRQRHPEHVGVDEAKSSSNRVADRYIQRACLGVGDAKSSSTNWSSYEANRIQYCIQSFTVLVLVPTRLHTVALLSPS